MSMVKSSKLLKLINYRLRVTIKDGRQLVGTLLAFDRHMNLVLGDCEEQRKTKQKVGASSRALEQTMKRMLGLILLRGENVVCMQVDSPPRGKSAKVPDKPGPGVARPAGRGAGMVGAGVPSGFGVGAAGIAPGLGAPMPSAMMPAGGMGLMGAGRGLPSSATASGGTIGQGQPMGVSGGASTAVGEGGTVSAAAQAPGTASSSSASAGGGSAPMQSGVS